MSGESPDFIASFMEDYFAESEEHLAAARRSLLSLEPAIGDDPPATVVEELFRSFHSLKGVSAMVELREAERLAHEMETYLGSIRDRRVMLSSSGFDALVDGVNELEQVIAARRAGGAIPAIDQHVIRLAEAGVAGGRASERGTGSAGVISRPLADSPEILWKVTFTPSAELLARGVKVDTVRSRLADIGRIESVTPRVTGKGGISFEFHVAPRDERAFASWRHDGVTCEPLPVPGPTIATSSSSFPPAPRLRPAETPAPTNFVRVDLARLDDLMRVVGDLVVSRARLEDTLRRVERSMPGVDWRALQQEAEGIERHLRELREGVMRVRLVRVAEIFRRMPFVVRDLARDSGKRVQLDLAGHATEIDKFLIERMMDPVLHLVRNAVSHGIELPEERVAAGKRPEGTIRLSASTVGESVMLEVSDDGRGLDLEDIASRARAAGLNSVERELDSRMLLDVICSSGFSTRDEADRASGRGVGMAVVRDAVQELGGTLSVETAVGRGTTFRAVLPLTLAITDALIVHVGDHTFAVPQAAVREVAEIEASALHPAENNELMVYRGAPMPVIRLAQLFELDAAPRQRMHVIVVGTGIAAVGILVDRVSGQREIVVKTLRDPLVTVTGVSGATELGDGRLVLIVDVAGLPRALRHRTGPLRAAV